MELQLGIIVMVSAPGDMVGENTLMGANRLSSTSNQGRGLLEVESEMLLAIGNLNASGQLEISWRFSNAAVAEWDEDTGYHLNRESGFTADVTAAKQHEEPREIAGVNASGTVTVSWLAPDDTTGFVEYIVRRTAGTVPVAFPTEGTDIPWTTGLSVTDTPGSGTFTYSVFASYDDLGGAVGLHQSDFGFAEVTV